MQRIFLIPIALFILLGSSLYTSGCIAPYGFETGRALGRGKAEVTIDVSSLRIDNRRERGLLFGVAGRIGLTDKLDMGAVGGGAALPYFFFRQQVVGDHFSLTALSIGAGAGFTQGRFTDPMVYLHFPLYYSVHSKELAWYLTPQYSVFFLTKGNNRLASVLSISTGIEYSFSSSIALGLNIGFAKPLDNSGNLLSPFTSGIGVKFRFNN